MFVFLLGSSLALVVSSSPVSDSPRVELRLPELPTLDWWGRLAFSPVRGLKMPTLSLPVKGKALRVLYF